MNIAVDGKEYLITAVEKDGALQHAIWSNSPYLSFFVFNGFRYEMMYSSLAGKTEEINREDLIEEAIENVNISIEDLPGYQTMLERLGKKD